MTRPHSPEVIGADAAGAPSGLGWPAVLIAAAAVHLAQAAWAAADRASFERALVPGDAGSGHLVHDYAAASATFGLLLLAAAVRPGWRVPALAAVTAWTSLHAVSHVVAAARREASALAIAEAGALVLSAVVLAALWRAAGRGR